MSQATLGEIAASLGGELIGDPGLVITRIGPLQGATAGTLSFLANPRYQTQLAGSAAGCVIVAPGQREVALARGATLVADDPYLYFARATQWWARRFRPAAQPGVHPSAVVDPAAEVAAGASIGPQAVIGARASIGEGAVIGAHCVVGVAARVGAGTRLAPRVILGDGCRIGARGVVQGGAVIGADGFGFAPAGGRWEKIEQLGAVRIGDDVEIGANTCIDRGALDDTVIEDGVKLDNQIQIGHNVHIGAHTIMAACSGVAGSATIGAHCLIGGAVNILGHIRICDRVTISACTFVSREILEPGHYSGSYPFDENSLSQKNAATLRQLHAMRSRLRALEKAIETPPPPDNNTTS